MLPLSELANGKGDVRVLITGISGFVGGHLANHIATQHPSAVIHGTVFTSALKHDFAHCHQVDLRDESAVYRLIKEIQPEYIYHLAAQAFVPRSFSHPWETIESNVRSQLNLTTACIQAGIAPRMLAVSSAEVYGVVGPGQVPMSEELPLRPSSPYSVSKVTQDMLALQYHTSHNLPIMRARPFNHFGPGQNARFVAPAFAMQIAKIEAGSQPPVIEVGDLSAKRDFTDVRDIVAAYRLILEQGTPGQVYNVASGKAYTIRALLDVLIAQVGQKIEIRVDKARLRPVDIPILLGDTSRLQEETGWSPTISFEQSLADILNDCRKRIEEAAS
jgi:GDP-4-dehydro-6-deoxy-D-mannose reductase